MSYIDAFIDKEHDRIHVVERIDGKRVFQEFTPNYTFYFDDPKGKHRTIYNTPVSRFTTRSGKEFQKEARMHSGKQVWESDLNPIYRCLEENFQDKPAPTLQTAFFDIEVAFDPDRGFSEVTDPFNPITAISVYMDWINKLVTLAVPPKSIDWETAEALTTDFSDTLLFREESEMIKAFLDIIEDADILSGWNSEGYDIPYTVNRMTRVLSKNDTRRLCLWNQFPKLRKFERFGKESTTYDLVGRVHMDYMQLYRKYTYHEMHSYSLDAICEYELNERKTTYEGTLDQLYNRDFKKFIEYNRQDTHLLHKLNQKLKFLDLACELAHQNTVLLQTTMGAVAVTEQAIINEAHNQGLIVPNRKHRLDSDDVVPPAAGAYVAYPKKGLHEDIAAIDIKSLYPSAIRALNMGNENIVGQLRPIMTEQYLKQKMEKEKCSYSAAWEGIFGSLEYTAVNNQEVGTEITIDWEETKESTVHSAAEVWQMIFNSNQPWLISANGTIFSYAKKGIIPGLLERWYSERQELQAKKKEATTKEDIAFWDKRQLVKKINLNSLYGAILNPGCRFNDIRIGQSTTLTGRSIAKHMASTVNQIATGEYDHVGPTIIYGDTDSVYFSFKPILKEAIASGEVIWDKSTCITTYDNVAAQVNESFPTFMDQAFHCPRQMGALIEGGRELVGSKGLFITKKRYAILIYDLEGKRLDVDGKPGKVKAMGLDLKRSDTPKVVQDFLSEILLMVLTNDSKDNVIEKIREFKIDFATKPAWEKGTPKRVNNLTKFTKAEEREGRANMPGHVRAAINWNTLKKMHSDNYSMSIVDGMKTVVCKLRDNPLGYTSIGYPTDGAHIPEWFKELPFDNDLMESTIVDQKIDNLLGGLGWDLPAYTDTKSTFDALFSFE